MEVWRRMRASGTPLETDTCNALMTACVECGQGERALRLLCEAQALGAHIFALIRLSCAPPAGMSDMSLLHWLGKGGCMPLRLM